MSRYNGIRTVTNGLVFCVDAANPQSIVSGQTVWKDLTFNTTGGTLVNGVGFSGSGISSALSFDGTNDFVRISSDQPFTPTNGFSVTSWANPTDITFQRYIEITRRQGAGALPTYLLSFQEYGDIISFGLKTTSTYNELDIQIKSGGTNTWTSYVGTWDGTNKRIYRNGSNIGQNSQVGTISDESGAFTSIGSLPSGSEYFKGRISQVQMYDRGLSPFEVYQNYNATKGRYGIPDIVTGGLVLNLDAGNPYSYNPDNTGSTVWSDVSYNTTGGTLINGSFYTGGTMQFDGVDDYIRTSYNQQLENFTICSFFKDTGSTGFARIVDKSFFDGFWLGRNGSGTNQYGGGCIQNSNYNFVTLTAGQWHFLAMVRNGTSLKVYGDGITNTNTTTCGSGPISSKTLHVGATINDGFPSGAPQRDWFTGNISNVQLYNRALTDNEILQNFNALRGRFGI